MSKHNLHDLTDKIVLVQEEVSQLRGTELVSYLLSMAVLEMNRFENVNGFNSAIRGLENIDEATRVRAS
ncbi:MAG: hypothetical protein AAFY99_11745 [Pseudomonadota bacterium]